MSLRFAAAYKTLSLSLLKLVITTLARGGKKRMVLLEKYWSSNVNCPMFLDSDRTVNAQRVVWLLARSYLFINCVLFKCRPIEEICCMSRGDLNKIMCVVN